MRTTICGALMSLAISAASAQEDTRSVSYMLPHCKAFLDRGISNTVLQQGRCVGVVEGLAFAMTHLSTSSFLCAIIPDDVPLEQEVRAVVRYIEARPHRMYEPFGGLAFEGLRSTWPCPKPPPKR